MHGDYKGETAYVSLLYGNSDVFILYALLLGRSLQHYDMQAARVLMIPKHGDSCLEQELQGYWQLHHVELIEAEHLDNTPHKRHKYVFTKLCLVTVPYKQILFLDLDVLVQSNLHVLFDIPAPAAKLHHNFDTRYTAKYVKHGKPIPPECFDPPWNSCVNAGVMRIDNKSTELERSQELHRLRRLLADDNMPPSMLPDQFFFVRKDVLAGWSHIDSKFNQECLNVCTEWGGNDQPALIHYSGKFQQPFDYIHVDPSHWDQLTQYLTSRLNSDKCAAAYIALLKQVNGREAPKPSEFTLEVISRLRTRSENYAHDQGYCDVCSEWAPSSCKSATWPQTRLSECWYCSRTMLSLKRQRIF